jgi:hypothetical protein
VGDVLTTHRASTPPPPPGVDTAHITDQHNHCPGVHSGMKSFGRTVKRPLRFLSLRPSLRSCWRQSTLALANPHSTSLYNITIYHHGLSPPAVFNGMRKMGISPGATTGAYSTYYGCFLQRYAAIQGIGGVRHLAIQYAGRIEFRTVALSSPDSKRDFATQLGRTELVDTRKQDAAKVLQDMGGASHILVTAPSAEAMSGVVGGLRKLLIPARKFCLHTLPVLDGLNAMGR